MAYRSRRVAITVSVLVLVVSLGVAGSASRRFDQDGARNRNTDLPVTSATKLEGVRWTLVSMRRDDADVTVDDTTITATFKEGRVTGTGVCNRFFASYDLAEGNAVTIGAVGATKMMCPRIDLENTFFTLLGEARHYKIEDGRLSLSGRTGVLVFEAKGADER